MGFRSRISMVFSGIGIIYSSFPTSADQAPEVSKVKQYKQGSIPHCIGRNDSVLDLFKHEKEFALVTSNGKIGGRRIRGREIGIFDVFEILEKKKIG